MRGSAVRLKGMPNSTAAAATMRLMAT